MCGEQTHGPAALTKMGAIMNTTIVRARVAPERQGISKVARRGPTHVCAKVGRIVVALMEYRGSQGSLDLETGDG